MSGSRWTLGTRWALLRRHKTRRKTWTWRHHKTWRKRWQLLQTRHVPFPSSFEIPWALRNLCSFSPWLFDKFVIICTCFLKSKIQYFFTWKAKNSEEHVFTCSTPRVDIFSQRRRGCRQLHHGLASECLARPYPERVWFFKDSSWASTYDLSGSEFWEKW